MKEEKAMLLDCVREKLRLCGYSAKTKKCYTDWIYRFLFFYDKCDLKCFGEQEIIDFIAFLEMDRNVAPNTKNQAVTAIHFLYREVLNIPVHSSPSKYSNTGTQAPVVLTREEIKKALSCLRGDKKLMVSLLYGCGLCLSECLQMRIRHVDFSNRKIFVGVGNVCIYRETIFPKSLIHPLKLQVEKVRILFEENNAFNNFKGVLLPISQRDEEPKTSKEFSWQYLLPSRTPRHYKTSDKLIQHPMSESFLQKTIKEVLRKCGIHKAACCHSFRHSFATHLLEDGYDIHLVQELLGHKHLQSTLVYKNLAKKNSHNIISPLDRLIDIENNKQNPMRN